MVNSALQEKIQSSNDIYYIYIIFTVVIFVITMLLYMRDSTAFTGKLIGVLFLTLFTSILIFIFFRFFQSASKIGENKNLFFNSYKYLYITLGVVTMIGLFSGILSLLGAFSTEPDDNYKSVLLNYYVITSFILLFVTTYLNIHNNKDNNIIFEDNAIFKHISDKRLNYTISFFVYIIAIIALYFINPWDIMTKYGGPTIFLSIFIGLIIICMIVVFNFYFNNPDKISSFNDAPTLFTFAKSIYILLGLFLSGLLLYWVLNAIGSFEQDSNTGTNVSHVILNFFILVSMFAVIYKVANFEGYLARTPVFRFIVNSFLYIPCLLVNIVDFINSFIGLPTKPGEFKLGTKSDMFFFTLILFMISIYLLCKIIIIPMITQYYYTNGGKQLINQPLTISELTNVSTYQDLNDTDEFNYQYALSFWVYIDALPPSTNSSYLKPTPILSYGENPIVKYEPYTNTLTITVSNTTNETNETNETNDITQEQMANWKSSHSDKLEQVKSIQIPNLIDNDGHRVLYKQTDWLLQKWNNIVLNYNGGTLDVFVNGELVKSSIKVVPYMKYDTLTVGTSNGITGQISNTMYFKKPMDVTTIYSLYNSLKEKNPPSIDTNDYKLIPL